MDFKDIKKAARDQGWRVESTSSRLRKAYNSFLPTPLDK